MNKKLSRHVFVGIISFIFVIVYLSTCMQLVFALFAPDRLVQKVMQNLTSQKGVLVEFDIPLKNLEPFYSEFFDSYKLSKTPIVDLLNIRGWIFYENKTQKISFQLGVKHTVLDTVIVEYEGYYDDNNVYFYKTCEVNPKRYVIYFEGKELLSKIGERIKATSAQLMNEMQSSAFKPKLLCKNNSTTIVVLSSVNLLSKNIPFSIEIDEQLNLEKINFYLDISNLPGRESEIEPTLSMDISTEIKEIPTFSPEELIRLDVSDLQLPLPVE